MSPPTPQAFIVFSDDWGGHPSSCQHLFRRIAGDHPVLWVNTIGMRRPKLQWSEIRKAWRKIARMLRSRQEPALAADQGLRLQVAQPWMLPFSKLGLVRGLNRLSVVRTVRRRARLMGLRDAIVVTTVPNAADYLGQLGEVKAVYYCVDDFAQWPGLEHDLVRAMEESLIAKAALMIATSQKLYRRMRASGKPTYLLTHGVDVWFFAQRSAAVHPCLAGIAEPRVGYFGLIDERSDQELIAASAARMPDVSFVLTGPVATDVSGLSCRPNVHFTGALPYAELPQLVAGLKALFIPYVVNDFTDSISPLKLKEYRATGLPVIATPMAEALLQRQHLVIAANASQWQEAIRAALAPDGSVPPREADAELAQESWDSKARQFLDIVLGRDGCAATGLAASGG